MAINYYLIFYNIGNIAQLNLEKYMNILLNEHLWSIGHFVLWLIVGRFILKNWFIFIFISFGWEVFEYYLPYEIAKETMTNKFTDIFINCIGFYLGNRSRRNINAKR
tara:strand:+ start:108 stop:428 length:321 start_codon:yes stop_codon:yes gene_type:complete